MIITNYTKTVTAPCHDVPANEVRAPLKHCIGRPCESCVMFNTLRGRTYFKRFIKMRLEPNEHN